ncbi:DUF732 domain-containing protein [Egbenema bharatensis]|uniref:DUF732 domain-containing protein n=1 Tax=Egbenema bharatensis TaxID=3463334 RepID=UPI003A853EF4
MFRNLFIASIAATAALTLTATPVQAQYNRAETDFLSTLASELNAGGLHRDARLVFNSLTYQRDAIDIGYFVCNRFRYGETPSSLMNQLRNRDYGIDLPIVAHAVTVSAATHLCPEFSYLASQSMRQPDYYSPDQSCTYRLRPDTNIRSGPSTTSNVIGNESTMLSRTIQLHSSETGRDGNQWSWIGYQGSDGRTAGWVRSDFVVCD